MADTEAERSKTGIWIAVASVVVAVVTFVVSRHFATVPNKQTRKLLLLKRPRVFHPLSKSDFPPIRRSLSFTLPRSRPSPGLQTPLDSKSDAARPAVSLSLPQPYDLLTPLVPWSRTASTPGTPTEGHQGPGVCTVLSPLWLTSLGAHHTKTSSQHAALSACSCLCLWSLLTRFYTQPSIIRACPRSYRLIISIIPSLCRMGRRQVVVSPPIQRPEIIAHIVILTESHDQGWSSYPQDEGTFRNSWTWLDLGVVRNTPGGIPAPEWRIYTNLLRRTTGKPQTFPDMNNETVGALLPGDSLTIWAGARCVFCGGPRL
jgi:hypothetical protein